MNCTFQADGFLRPWQLSDAFQTRLGAGFGPSVATRRAMAAIIVINVQAREFTA